MKTAFTILGFLVVLVLLLAACNSGRTSFVPSTPTEEEHGHEDKPIEGALEARVEGGDFYFEPQTLHLHEGEPVNIVFVNNGSVAHEFVVEEFGFGFHVGPGGTGTAGFTPDTAGEFEIGCYIPGHYEAGMKGTLIVEESHGS